MKNKRRIVVFLVMASILVGLVGLTSATFAQMSDKKDSITLHILTPLMSYATAMQEIVGEEFTKRTGIKIEVETVPYSVIHERTVFELTTESPSYDLITGGAEYADEIVASGYVLSLESFMADPTLPRLQLENLSTWSDPFNIHKGERYAISINDTPDGYIWRKDLFEKAGLPGAAKTWDEYLDYAKKLTKGDVFGAVLLMGAQDEGQSGFMRRVYGFEPFEDGRYIYNSKNEVIIDNRKAVRALEIMKGVMPWSPPGTLSYAYGEGNTAWMQGKIAQATTWLDMLQEVEKPDVSKVAGLNGYSPMPGVEPTRVYNAMAGSQEMWINKASEHPREAYKFMAYLSEGEAYQHFFDYGELGNSCLAVRNNPENWAKSPFMAMWAQVEKTLPLVTGHPEFPEEQRIMYDEVAAFLSDKKSAQAAIKDMAANLEKLMKKAGYYD